MTKFIYLGSEINSDGKTDTAIRGTQTSFKFYYIAKGIL
jgi:hypothetical protein